MSNKRKKMGVLGAIEKVGNVLPHPTTLFIILCGIIMVVSHIAYKCGVGVTYESIDIASGELKEATVNVVSLLTPEGIRYVFTSAISNFTGFELY